MKINFSLPALLVAGVLSLNAAAQTAATDTAGTGKQQLYIDVHQLQPGKVKFADVAAAHAKDLAVQNKYGVQFLKYWVNEKEGLVYCLSAAADSAAIKKAHAEAHGLLPAYTFKVTDGTAAALLGKKNFFLDIHQLGAGNVTAKAVAAAHQKDLAVQGKYGVNFINYWVDENAGVVLCLSEAANAEAVIKTHKEAHGLVPATVLKVKQGE